MIRTPQGLLLLRFLNANLEDLEVLNYLLNLGLDRSVSMYEPSFKGFSEPSAIPDTKLFLANLALHSVTDPTGYWFT